MYQKILSAAVLIICMYTDIRDRKISRSLLFLYLLLVCIGHITEGTREVWMLTEQSAERLQFVQVVGQGILKGIKRVIPGMLPGICCLIVSFLTRQALGYGDSILIIICGMALGIEKMYAVLITGLFWAGIWAFIAWRFTGKSRSEEIPFVPFLFAGFMIQSFSRI